MRTLSMKWSEMVLSFEITPKNYSLLKPFTISRGSRNFASTLSLKLRYGDIIARSNCVPYARYAEDITHVAIQIKKAMELILAYDHPTHDLGAMRRLINTQMRAGSARNALDCALWDLESKIKQKPIWQLADLKQPASPISAYTISMDHPDAMADHALGAKHYQLLKIKLAGDQQDIQRILKIHQAVPKARLIVDANEGFTIENLETLKHIYALNIGLEMIEQPVKAGHENLLAQLGKPNDIIICADESIHVTDDLKTLSPHYRAINIKLDKSGGLSEAICLLQSAQKQHLKIMIGCMMAGSLAMAPAFLLSSYADWVDLDGPLWLDDDDENGFKFDQIGRMQTQKSDFWGY
ncbi:MAG: dipeptide epimerase [Pseudomonadota bacterium]